MKVGAIVQKSSEWAKQSGKKNIIKIERRKRKRLKKVAGA